MNKERDNEQAETDRIANPKGKLEALREQKWNKENKRARNRNENTLREKGSLIAIAKLNLIKCEHQQCRERK